jgi:hypothetical protein
LQAKVLKVLAHVFGANTTHVKVETNQALGPPAELLELLLHEVPSVQQRTVKGATLLGDSTNEVNLAEGDPVTLNHFLPEGTVLGQRGWLSGARGTEVAEEGRSLFHVCIIH